VNTSPLLLAALGLLIAGPAQAGVTVVDASSPVPVVQAAVDAAANGDILLVQPGEIDGGSTITIDGKGPDAHRRRRHRAARPPDREEPARRASRSRCAASRSASPR
jgi:hypothetical protein